MRNVSGWIVERMMDLHMVVNTDHMSQAGVDRTLSLLEARNYSGVISPHGWMDPGNWPRIWKLGGMAFPGHSAADVYVKEWQEYRPRSTPYQFGWGYGADLGGLSEQPGTDAGGAIAYPFKSLDGQVTFQRQKTGDRTFDYNTDGVAQYGLYADWFADLRRVGGDALVKDVWNGAEAYLEMWERAEGIATPGCASASASAAVDATGVGALKLGQSWDTLLKGAGQPQQRNRAWSYCVAGDGNEGRADVAELTQDGTVELVGSTATGRSAGGVPVGTPASALPASMASAGSDVRFVTTAQGTTWAYAIRDGAVSAVATAAPVLARDRDALAAAMARLASATATQTAAPFEAGATQSAQQAAGEQPTGQPLATQQMTSQPLAGAADATVTAALAALCHLQISAPG